MIDSETIKSIESKEKLKSREKVSKFFDADDWDDCNMDDSDKKKGDLNQFIIGAFGKMNIKIAILLFFIYVIINSEIFIDNVLSKFSNTVDNGKTTNKGVMISALFVTLSYIIVDMLF